MQTNLTLDDDFALILIADRLLLRICIIECDGDCRFCYAALAFLVYEIIVVLSTNIIELRDAEQKADAVENIRLAGTIEAGDRIELMIEFLERLICTVRLEALDFDISYFHSKIHIHAASF